MSEITRGVMGMPFEMAMCSYLARQQFYAIAREVYAENESLRADAERYRLMRKITLAQIDDTQDEFDAEFDRQTNSSPENS